MALKGSPAPQWTEAPSVALPATRLSAQKIVIPRRNSIATYTDQNGVVQTAAINELRDKHYVDGVLQPPLIEGESTNLLLHSEEFDDPYFARVATGTGVLPVIVPNADVAPDGQMTADKVTFSVATDLIGDQSFLQANAGVITAGAVYGGSLFLKAFSGADVGKTVVLRHVDRASFIVVVLTDEWQRVGGTNVAFNATLYFGFGLRGTTGSSTGTVSVSVWGGDVEPSSVTSYIKTIDTPVTRAADLEETIWVLRPGASNQQLKRDAALGILADDGTADVGFPISTLGKGRFPITSGRLSRPELTRTLGAGAAVASDYFFGSATLSTTVVRPTKLPSGGVVFY